MYFVGIITDNKSKKYINKIIKEQIKTNQFQVIFITEKNVDNLKNIHFDTIVINKKINYLEYLKNNLDNSKIIINSDLNIDLSALKELNLHIISYGFNSKSTITISSNTEDSIQICIQRNICIQGEKVEQQEISKSKKVNTDIYDIMIIIIIILIYKKDIIGSLKL